MGIIVADEIYSKENPTVLLPSAYICLSLYAIKIIKRAAGGYDIISRFDVYSSLPAKEAGGSVIDTLELSPIHVDSYPTEPNILAYNKLKMRYTACYDA